jgi:hypothetical protein
VQELHGPRLQQLHRKAADKAQMRQKELAHARERITALRVSNAAKEKELPEMQAKLDELRMELQKQLEADEAELARLQQADQSVRVRM